MGLSTVPLLGNMRGLLILLFPLLLLTMMLDGGLCAAPTAGQGQHGVRSEEGLRALNCSLALRVLRCEDEAAQISPAIGAGAVEDYCPRECGRDTQQVWRRLTEEKPPPPPPPPSKPHSGGEEPAGHEGAPGDSDGEGGGEHDTHEHGGEGHEGGEGEEGEGGEGEEEEEVERVLEANTTWAVFVILILVTLAFESVQETLDEKAGEDLGEIVDELFGELTVLGFIGLLTSALINSGAAEKLSNDIFGKAEEEPMHGGECPEEEEPVLVEILEDLHMKLFFMMVVFICEVVVLIEIGKTNNRLWSECQAASADADEFKQHYDNYKLEPDHDDVHGANSRGGLLGVFQRHRLSKHTRIMEFDRLKARFIQLAARHPGRKVDGSFDMASYLRNHQRETFIGIVSINHFVWLVVILSSPLLRLALSFGHHGRAIVLIGTGWLLLIWGMALRHHMGAVRGSITPRLPPKVPVVSSSGGNTGGDGFSTEGLATGLLGAAVSGGVQRTSSSSSRRSTVDSSVAKLQAHAPASLAPEILSEPAVELVPPFREDRDIRHHALFIPEILSNCISEQLTLHGPVACRCVVSLLLLCAASLVAVLAHDGHGLLLEGQPTGVGITMLVVTVAPLALLLLRVVPHACQDYVVATCVEELIEDETLSRTITEQTAQRMVHAFKVLTSIRKQALLIGKISGQTGQASGNQAAGGRGNLHHRVTPALRRELDELFSHYDADGSGNVDYGEFLLILKQVSGGSNTYNDDELRSMFAALDTDGT